MNWPLGLIVPVQDPTPFSPFEPEDWPDSLAQVRDGGYEGVELAITEPRKVLPSELEAALGQTRLRLIAVTTGQAAWKEGLSLSSPDEMVRAGAIARIQDHMRLVRRFGAVVIVGLLRGRSDVELLIESLRECAAFDPQVRLALEPLNRYESSLGNTVAEVLKWVDKIGKDNVGILVDTFHANIEERTLEEAVRSAGERLFHVHLADSNRWVPGYGHLEFAPLWLALDSVRYSGALVLECLPKPSTAAVLSSASWIRSQWT